MHWLSFLIGGLAGWLISWLIDYLICRPRRMAAEALLNARLEQGNVESASLRAQLDGYETLRARLGGANAELEALRAQVAGMKDLQTQLDDANAELDALRVQAGGIGDLQVRLDGATTEIEALRSQLAGRRDLQADLVAWKAQAMEQGLEIERLNAELAAHASPGTTPAVTMEAGADASAMPAAEMGPALAAPAAEPGAPDDLTRIEGIGPKISALFNQNGLYTFAQLGAASVEELRSILSSGGPRFRLADPQTWPEQAAFARDGKWDALQAFQDTLKAGRVA